MGIRTPKALPPTEPPVSLLTIDVHPRGGLRPGDGTTCVGHARVDMADAEIRFAAFGSIAHGHDFDARRALSATPTKTRLAPSHATPRKSPEKLATTRFRRRGTGWPRWIPPEYVGKTLHVRVDEHVVRVVEGTNLIAKHTRSWDGVAVTTRRHDGFGGRLLARLARSLTAVNARQIIERATWR
jgi:hypothetical protein